MTVGEKIKKYLIENGITQSFVSKKTETPRSTLNLMLNGKAPISVEKLLSICKAIKRLPSEFVDGDS